MHILVFVIIPSGVLDVEARVRSQMHGHKRSDSDPPHGRWDYYTIGGLWDGKIRPDDLPRGRPFSVENNLCPMTALQPESEVVAECGAVITPDGGWHERRDYISEQTWLRYCHELFREHADGDIVAIDAHA